MNRWTPPNRSIELVSGTQVEVVGVHEEDLGAGRTHFVRAHGLHGRERADGHERRRPDLAAACRDDGRCGATGIIGAGDAAKCEASQLVGHPEAGRCFEKSFVLRVDS